MDDLDDITIIFVVAFLGVLAYFGYSLYEDYQGQSKDPNVPGVAGSLGTDKPASFGAFVLDSAVSLGNSPEDFSNALTTSILHPIGTLESIFGIGNN